MNTQSAFFEFEKTNNKLLLELNNHASIIDYIVKKNATILLPFNQTLLDIEINIHFIESHIVLRKSSDPTCWVSMNGIRGRIVNENTQISIIAGPPRSEEQQKKLRTSPSSVFNDMEEFNREDRDLYHVPTEPRLHILRKGTYSFPKHAGKFVIPLFLISQPILFPELDKPKRRNSFSSSDSSSGSSKLNTSASLPNLKGHDRRQSLPSSKKKMQEVQRTLVEYMREENIVSSPRAEVDDIQVKINDLLTLHDKNNSEKVKSDNTRLFSEFNNTTLSIAENDSDTSSERSSTSSLTVKNKKYGFSDFVEKMRHESSTSLVKKIKKFITELNREEYIPENTEKPETSFPYRVQRFLQELMREIQVHPQWKNASEQEIDNAREGVEKYVMTKLYHKVFSPTIEDVNLDNEVATRLSMFAKKLQPHHLDIDPRLVDDTPSTSPENSLNSQVALAISELKKINTYKTPRDKMICISNCCKIVFNIITTYNPKEHASADAFLPVLIFLVMKANPPHLHSNLKYIQEFRNPDKLLSESGYFLTNLQSCLVYWKHADHTTLSISKEEYDTLFGKENEQGMNFFESDEDDINKHISETSNEAPQEDSVLEESIMATCETSTGEKIELEVKAETVESPMPTPSTFASSSFPVSPTTNLQVTLPTAATITTASPSDAEEEEDDVYADQTVTTPGDSIIVDESVTPSPDMMALEKIEQFERNVFSLGDDPLCAVSSVDELTIRQVKELLVKYRQTHALLSQVKHILTSK